MILCMRLYWTLLKTLNIVKSERVSLNVVPASVQGSCYKPSVSEAAEGGESLKFRDSLMQSKNAEYFQQ